MAEKDSENLKGDKKEEGPSRREFLRLVGLAAGGGALLAANRELLSEGGAAAAAIAPASIPPHRSFLVDGIHAYADQLSVKPGKTINFFVSSDSTYNLQIYRLGLDPNKPSSDVAMSGVFPGAATRQSIQPGSYVWVKNGLPATDNLTALTLECWVRPFVGRKYDVLNYSGLITQLNYVQNAAAPGYGLFVRFDIDDFSASSGRVAFYLGNGATSNLLEVPWNFNQDADGHPVGDWAQFQWYHIVATWDGTTQKLWINGGINGQPQGTKAFPGSLSIPDPVKVPLRLAAFGDANAQANNFLNGDLAMPVIYNKALSQADIQNRFNQQGLQPPALYGEDGKPVVLACWPLSEEQGSNVADISPSVPPRPGLIINHATWQIGGPSFDAGMVGQFENYDPSKDPRRGHGLRFASDDLFDCRWQVTQTYTVPVNARSGIYVARLTYPDPPVAGQTAYYHVTFIVQPNRQGGPILLVCPTNTWLAYNSKPFLKRQYEPDTDSKGFLFKERYVQTFRRDEASPLDAPQYSCYLVHQDFAPGYHFGRLLPNPAADPYVIYGSVGDYSHLTRVTRSTQVWLESNHYPYDVISDLDLHTTPGILKNYQTVILPGHSEYWSISAYNGLKSYLSNGGRLVVLSGNTMYWRVSFSPDGAVMECRKADGVGKQVNPLRRGEIWHSDDGLRGGLMRECGFPGWQLTGLETFGIFDIPPGDSGFGTFHVKTPQHFLWHGLGVTDGQDFAPNTVGHESDVRVATLEAFRTAPVPDGATPPVEPPGITTLALAPLPSVAGIERGALDDYFLQGLSVDPKNPVPVAEVIYWERPNGGRVFNGGAIGNGFALLNDSIFGGKPGLMRNVLINFLS